MHPDEVCFAKLVSKNHHIDFLIMKPYNRIHYEHSYEFARIYSQL
jgi:hypothetical protein